MSIVERDYLGTGWQFPVRPNRRGEIEQSSGVDDIEGAIRIVLGTAKGERIMRPEFGCGIHEYVFTSMNATVRTLIETAVEDALVKWEPRIEVSNVEAPQTVRDDGVLPIRLDYRVRQSNTEHNLVYPFYLTEGRRE